MEKGKRTGGLEVMGRCWPWSHSWSKWEQKPYTRTIVPSPLQGYSGDIGAHTKEIKVTMQERRCLACGRVQVKGIS